MNSRTVAGLVHKLQQDALVPLGGDLVDSLRHQDGRIDDDDFCAAKILKLCDRAQES